MYGIENHVAEEIKSWCKSYDCRDCEFFIQQDGGCKIEFPFAWEIETDDS